MKEVDLGFKGEKGPWQVQPGMLGSIISDDFSHDAQLIVRGDFGSDEALADYCKWLADTLSKACK